MNDASGQSAGTIGPLVIDPLEGRINYVVLSTRDQNSATTRIVALPWEALQASRTGEKDQLQTRVQSDKLQTGPEFDDGEENWKQMSDPVWVRTVYTHYAVRPYWHDDGMRDARGDTGRDDRGRGDKRDDKQGDDKREKRDEPKRDRDGRTPPQRS